jgi:hypothetical protein
MCAHFVTLDMEKMAMVAVCHALLAAEIALQDYATSVKMIII